MQDYTDEDVSASEAYARTQADMLVLHAIYREAPHLASHVRWRISDEVDYFVPDRLRSTAKKLHLEVTKTLCEQVACVPMKEQGPCRGDEPASYYYRGDDALGVQCQPACFNMAPKPQFNATGERVPESDWVVWNEAQQACRLVNQHSVQHLEKPFYRSDVRFERRINDMPTGFSRVPNAGNPDGTGMTYRNNRAYCNYFDQGYDRATDKCTQGGALNVVGNAIIGQALLNAIRSTARMVTGAPMLSQPENLPPKPAQLEERYTVSGWRANVDRSFTLPTLLDPFRSVANGSGGGDAGGDSGTQRAKRSLDGGSGVDDDGDEAYWRSVHNRQPHQRERLERERAMQRKMATDDDDDECNDADNDETEAEDADEPGTRPKRAALSGAAQRKARNRAKTKSSTQAAAAGDAAAAAVAGSTPPTALAGKIDLKGDLSLADDTHLLDRMPKAVLDFIDNLPEKTRGFGKLLCHLAIEMVHSLGDEETQTAIGLNIAAEALRQRVRKMGINIIERLSKRLATEVIRMGGTVSQNALRTAMRGFTRNVVVGAGTRMASRGALMLSRFLVAASSVVGWLLMATMLADLLLQYFDPFGYSNQLPEKYPVDYMEAGERVMRDAFGTVHPEYSFERLAEQVLGRDRLFGIQLETIHFRTLYLESLTVNSNGTRLDHGPRIEIVPLSDDHIALLQNAGMARRLRFDAERYVRDGWYFKQRVRLNLLLNRVAAGIVAVTVVLAALRQRVFVTLLVLLTIVLLAAARLSLQSDWLVETMARCTNRSFDPEYRLVAADRGYLMVE